MDKTGQKFCHKNPLLITLELCCLIAVKMKLNIPAIIQEVPRKCKCLLSFDMIQTALKTMYPTILLLHMYSLS
jgi:hypothetical protein